MLFLQELLLLLQCFYLSFMQLRREFQLVTGIGDRVSNLVSEWVNTWQRKLLEYFVKEAESSSCLAAKIAKLKGKPKQQAYENSVIKLYFR